MGRPNSISKIISISGAKKWSWQSFPSCWLKRPCVLKPAIEALQGALKWLVHSGVSSATRRKATGADQKKMEFQQCHETRSFVFARKFFEHEFYFVLEKSRTNNLYKPVFDVFFWRQQFVLAEAVAKFLSNDTHERCVCNRTFSSQGSSKEPSLVQTRVKAKDRKQAQTLFPSVRWSKSWNLRDGLCVWVEGFFKLCC